MGLLDSNKFSFLNKSSVINVDLGTTGSVGSFNTKGFNVLVLQVATDYASDIDIVVKGNLASPLSTLEIHDVFTDKIVGEKIISAGTYYVDCSKFDSVAVYNNTAITGKTATIRTSLKQTNVFANKEKSNYEGSGSITKAITSVTSLVSITNLNRKYSCLYILISSLSDGGNITVKKSSIYLPIKNQDGEISYSISKPGIYYVSIVGIDTFSITNQTGVSEGSVTFSYALIPAFPTEISELHPMQLIKQFDTVLTEGQTSISNVLTFPERELIKHFKFLYIALYSYDSTNTRKSVSATVKWYGYDVTGSSWTDGDIIGEFDSKYRFQSDWFNAKGLGGGALSTALGSGAAAGDVIKIKLIGIR